MLAVFGYPYTIELSTRPENALGEAAQWETAEATLADVLRRRGQEFTIDEGGGAFYGPKLDFKLIDAIGRKWQGPTVQLDFNLPERFELEFIGSDNAAHRPVMLHRVLVGSMERFVGGLIEHYAGAFPVWLSPVQVVGIPVAEDFADYLGAVIDRLRGEGVRAELDASDERMQKKIRTHTQGKVPFQLIAGANDAAAGTVSFRFRDGTQDNGVPIDEAVRRIHEAIDTHAQV
jgi:threonyl-tRNA synthetase